MVVCLEQSADLHMAQLMPLPHAVSCFSKIQIGFTFLVPAHLGSPGQRAVKRVCVCVCRFCLRDIRLIVSIFIKHSLNVLISLILLQNHVTFIAFCRMTNYELLR